MSPVQLWAIVLGEITFTLVVMYGIFGAVKQAGKERSWNKFDILCFALVYILIGGGTSLGITILYALHAYR